MLLHLSFFEIHVIAVDKVSPRKLSQSVSSKQVWDEALRTKGGLNMKAKYGRNHLDEAISFYSVEPLYEASFELSVSN